MTDTVPASAPEQPEEHPVPPEAAPSTADKAKSNKQGFIILGSVVAAIALCCGGLTSFGNDGNGAKDDSIAAYNACKGYVKAHLKAPSTAKFSNPDFYGSGTRWIVKGDVDAQNSFGAMIRNQYRCEITGSGQSWSLVSVTVG